MAVFVKGRYLCVMANAVSTSEQQAVLDGDKEARARLSSWGRVRGRGGGGGGGTPGWLIFDDLCCCANLLANPEPRGQVACSLAVGVSGALWFITSLGCAVPRWTPRILTHTLQYGQSFFDLSRASPRREEPGRGPLVDGPGRPAAHREHFGVRDQALGPAHEARQGRWYPLVSKSQQPGETRVGA